MSRLLTDLKPEIRPKVDAFLAACEAANIDLIVTCTSRTAAEQTVLWNQGRTTPGRIVTNAKAGQSAHNYGLAIDIVPVLHGKLIWDDTDPVWQEIGRLGQAAGLVWLGAAGSTFREDPHFELPNWRKTAGVS